LVKGQGHWERKCKNLFSRMSSSKVDRLTSNEGQNDHRPILHVSSNFISENASLCDIYLFLIIRKGRVSQRPR